MRTRGSSIKFVVAAFVALALAGCAEAGDEGASADGAAQASPGRFTFAGGPSGGTFQYYASGISTLAGRSDLVQARVLARATGGSVENLRLVNSGQADFGVVYAGNVWQGRHGRLEADTVKYEDVRAVAYLYGAPAQLIVRQGSGIETPADLAGKRVAVGNAGSGAAYNAELFFKQLGIWDQLQTEFLGYRNAAQAFQNRQIDAFWVFAGFPSAAVLEAALQEDIKLLDTYAAADGAGLFDDFPYFSRVVIPAGTYEGQDEDVQTFQDAALWVANADVPAQTVNNLLTEVFSEAGLSYMVSTHKSAEEMSIEGGTQGVVTPFHAGAEQFWNEHGVEMQPERLPEQQREAAAANAGASEGADGV
jgi:TRAP transporter TAXI family solute receptor